MKICIFSISSFRAAMNRSLTVEQTKIAGFGGGHYRRIKQKRNIQWPSTELS